MPKITLIPIKGNSYICDGFLSIGVYLQDRKALLIDSGGDDSCAKDVNNALEAEGYEVSAIINTHCHGDHCGGNSFFQKRYPNLKTFAAYNEKFFIEDPLQAPRCFCGGAAPFAGLKNKYISPQKTSIITNVIAPYEDQTLTINETAQKIITLPGHTQGMVGVITPDNILYSGDALFGEETLRKHPILFYTDIAATLTSFTKLEQLSVDACALYHGGVIHNLPALVAQHREKILQTKDAVLDLIQKESSSIDALTQRIMQHFGIPDNLIAFTLTQTALKAYVTLLEEEKAVKLVVNKGLLVVAGG
jgi:glyoxylase-like metal-dependent hydrolase (beta-lactamase superfamily II)